MLASFLCREVLLHILCWLLYFFYLGSFSYTSHAGFIFMRVVSLTHLVLALFLSGEFLLHIPCLLIFFFSFSLGSLSYTSHTILVSLSLSLCGEFLLDIPCWLYFYMGHFLTHPMLASFLSGEFPLHIPCRFNFYLGNFSYTLSAGFIFIWGVSLTHPVLAYFFFSFSLGSLSYTYNAVFVCFSLSLSFHVGSFS